MCHNDNQYEPAIMCTYNNHCILVQHILPRPALISYLAPVLIGSNQILETVGNKATFLVARLKVIAGVND